MIYNRNLYTILLILLFVLISLPIHAKEYKNINIVDGNGMENDETWGPGANNEYKKINEISNKCFKGVVPAYKNSADLFIDKLIQLKYDSTKDDLTIITLNGHGQTEEDAIKLLEYQSPVPKRETQKAIKNSKEYRSKNGYKIKDHYIALSDGTQLSAYDFLDNMEKIKGQKIILITSCYSGRYLKIFAEQIRKGRMKNFLIMTTSSEDYMSRCIFDQQNLGYAFFDNIKCECNMNIKKIVDKIKNDAHIYQNAEGLEIGPNYYNPQYLDTFKSNDYIIDQK